MVIEYYGYLCLFQSAQTPARNALVMKVAWDVIRTAVKMDIISKTIPKNA